MKKLTYFFLMITVLIIILITTSLGLNTIASLAQRLSPAKFTMEEVHGKLLSDITIKNLSYQNNSVDIKVAYLHLNILKRQLKANHSIIHILPPISTIPNKKKSFSYKKLKWLKYIKINTIHLEDFTIHRGDIHEKINSFLLHTKKPNHYLLKMILPHGEIQGNIFYLDQPFQWQITLVGKEVKLALFDNLNTQAIQFNLKNEGVWNKTAKLISFNLKHIEGQIFQYHFNGNSDLIIDKEKLNINQLNLQIKSPQLTLQALTKWNDVNINLIIPNLKYFSPTMRGKIEVNAILPLSKPPLVLKGKVKTTTLNSPYLSLKTLSANIQSTLDWQSLKIHTTLQYQLLNHPTMQNMDATCDFQLVKNNIVTTFSVLLNPLNELKGHIIFYTVGQLFNPNQKWQGQFSFHLPNINQWATLPEIMIKKGNLNGHFKLNGTIKNPRISGQASLINGDVSIPKLGTHLNAINVKADVHPNQTIAINSQFKVGKGSATFDGKLNFKHLFPLNFTLSGKALELIKLKQYKITGDPHLFITLNNHSININGDIFLPFIHITANETNQATTLPPEAMIVDSHSKQEIPFETVANIRLRLGEDIFVSYKEMQAHLKGQLTVSKIAGGLPTAVGTIYINKGSYSIYHRRLTINHGRLIYLGNVLTNPALSIKAIKNISPSTLGQLPPLHPYVGAFVQGTLDRPEITLISNPSMSKNDILSYLILGNPLSSLTDPSAFDLLNNAAAGLSLLNSNLNEDAGDEGTTPTIFNIKLFNPLQLLNHQYQLSPHFFIQTKTNFLETSANILYLYEND